MDIDRNNMKLEILFYKMFCKELKEKRHFYYE